MNIICQLDYKMHHILTTKKPSEIYMREPLSLEIIHSSIHLPLGALRRIQETLPAIRLPLGVL